MKQLITLLAILISIQLNGQEFGTAILLDKKECTGKFQTILADKINKDLLAKKAGHLEFFTWDGKSESTPIPFSRYKADTDGERPITKAIYLKTHFEIENKLEPTYLVDTTGAVTKMSLGYPYQINPVYKIVDLSTSEVLRSKVYNSADMKNWKKESTYEVKDFKKYFGKNPKKMKSDAFRKAMKEYLKDNQKSIDKFYTDKFHVYAKQIAGVGNILKSMYDKRLYIPEDFVLNKKGKLEEFYLDVKASDIVSKGDDFAMYKKQKFGNLEEYHKVFRIAYATVEEVGENRSKLKPITFTKKKMGKAFQEGGDIVFARNIDLINTANRSSDQKIRRAQVKSKCFTCNSYLESILLNIASIKLIERNFDGPIKYFTDQYTNEKYIDFNLSAAQDKQEGIEFIFEDTDAGMKATEVETGRIASMNQKKAKGIMKLVGNTGPQTYNLCMDILDSEVQILEVLKQKKGKVKEILAYNEMGFEGITTYEMFLVTEEKVGGRILNRDELIGKCYVREEQTEKIYKIKIAKGEKELFNAIENGDKIKFRVKL